MYIIWWEVLLTVFIPLLLATFLILYRYYSVPKTILDSNELELNKLETGDLVFMQYSSKYSTLIKIFNLSSWSHCGFVLKENDDIYIIEVAEYKDTEYKGLCIIPLEQWKELNTDRICGYRKYNGIKPKNNKIYKFVQNFKNITLDLDLIHWISTLSKKSWSKHEYKNYYFCSEFIALMLQELNMIPPKWKCNCYTPKDLSIIHSYTKIHSFLL